METARHRHENSTRNYPVIQLLTVRIGPLRHHTPKYEITKKKQEHLWEQIQKAASINTCRHIPFWSKLRMLTYLAPDLAGLRLRTGRYRENQISGFQLVQWFGIVCENYAQQSV